MSKQDKRKQLVNAAHNVFIRRGYHNSSIKDIADEAGMTPGLIHYYFNNKEELLLSVQDEVQKHYHQQYEGHEANSETLESVLLEIKSRAEKNPDWYRWRYEIYSLATKRESGQFEEKVASVLKNGRKSLFKVIRQLSNDPQRDQGLAGILLACFDGLALQKIVDNDFDLDQSYKVLKELVELYISSRNEV